MEQELRHRKFPKGDGDEIYESNNVKEHTKGNFSYSMMAFFF